MIRLYDEDSEIKTSNEVDLDDLLSTMDEIDEFYKNRKEIPAEFITIHKNILYFAILYILENENKESEKIIKEGIKFWEKFDEKQQAVIISNLLKKYNDKSLIDDDIKSWFESTAKIQKRYL